MSVIARVFAPQPQKCLNEALRRLLSILLLAVFGMPFISPLFAMTAKSACLLPQEWKAPLHDGRDCAVSAHQPKPRIPGAPRKVPILPCICRCGSWRYLWAADPSGNLCGADRASSRHRTDRIEAPHFAQPFPTEARTSRLHHSLIPTARLSLPATNIRMLCSGLTSGF
jgi:hypothetical protein